MSPSKTRAKIKHRARRGKKVRLPKEAIASHYPVKDGALVVTSGYFLTWDKGGE